MLTEYLEHANITVTRLAPALQFLRTALPSWRVRGQGEMDWFGTPIQWLHVGTDSHYIALQSGGRRRTGLRRRTRCDRSARYTRLKRVTMSLRRCSACGVCACPWCDW